MAKKPHRPLTPSKKSRFVPIVATILVVAILGGGLFWYQRRPPDARRHVELGAEYARKGSGAMAMREYQAAAKLDKTYSAAYLGMSKIQENAGNFAAAADLLGTVLYYHPQYPHIQCQRAELYGMANRFEIAYIVAQDAVKIEPDCPVAHNALGMLLEKSNDFPGAARELGRAHSLSPGDEALTLNYARLLAKSGRPDDARLIVESVLPVTKLYVVQANYLEGWLLSEYGRGGRLDLDTAQTYLGKALALNSKHTASLTQSGLIFLRERKYNAALVDLEKAFYYGPATIEIIDGLVDTYTALNDPKLPDAIATRKRYQAVILLVQELRHQYILHPDDLGIMMKLANSEIGVGNTADAFNLVKLVLAKAPKRKDAVKLYNEMKSPSAPQIVSRAKTR